MEMLQPGGVEESFLILFGRKKLKKDTEQARERVWRSPP